LSAAITWFPYEVFYRALPQAISHIPMSSILLTLAVPAFPVLGVAGLLVSRRIRRRCGWRLLALLTAGVLALFVYFNIWGVVRGTVTRSGEPVAGAQVEFVGDLPLRQPGPLAWVAYFFDDPNVVRRYKTKTRADGSYCIWGLRPGDYEISVRAPPPAQPAYKWDWFGGSGPPTLVKGGLQKVDMGF
jgi:hypothetical protein